MFEEAVLTEIMRQTPVIQKAVYNKELSDADELVDWLMSQKSVMPRLNKRILDSSSGRYLNLIGQAHPELNTKEELSALRPSDLLATMQGKLQYVVNDRAKCLPVSIWVVGNLQTPATRQIVAAALRYMRESSDKIRLALIHTAGGPLTAAYEAGLQAIADESSLNFSLAKLLDEKNAKKVEENVKNAAELVTEVFRAKFQTALKADNNKFPAIHEAVAQNCLGINTPNAVVVNGRVIEIPDDELFNEDDFSLIEKHIMSTYGDKVYAELGNLKNDGERCSNTFMKMGSVLLAEPNSKQRHDIRFHADKHSVINLPPADANAPALDVIAVVEPLSRGAQKLAPILITLQKVVNMKIRVFLNCVDKHSDMPLKTFFRYVLDSEPNFGQGGPDDVPSWRAHFGSMPVSPLFTLAMVTPENWLVEAVRSPFDLDNIHLEEVEGGGVWGDFELAHLLLEGHCFEQSSGNPPRGLQFVLGTSTTPITADTLVMANLGYLQLKANPGAWNLKLRSGRSADIYTIVSHEGTEVSRDDSQNILVLMSHFRSNVIKVKVSKKPGKQHEDLLRDDDEPDESANSLWGSFSSWTGSSSKPEQNASKDAADDKLNIFSVASGHLYERLLRIMMLSVLKHTKTPVKFWFLKVSCTLCSRRRLIHFYSRRIIYHPLSKSFCRL